MASTRIERKTKMVNKEEILAIREEMKCIQNNYVNLSKEYALKAKELLNKVLTCKEVLTEAEWLLQGDKSIASRNSKHKMLSEFLQTDHHDHFENDDLFLNFDDHDIYINFKSKENLTKFIECYNITFNIKSFKDRASNLKNELIKLEKEIEKIEKLQHNV